MKSARDAAPRAVNRLLRMAVVGGVEPAVLLHIRRGDDVNALDDRGMTLLMLAAAKNRARICRLLIDAGADLWARDTTGNDALGIALGAGALDAAREIKFALEALPQDARTPIEAGALNVGAPASYLRGDERSDNIAESTGRVDDAPNSGFTSQCGEVSDTTALSGPAAADALTPVVTPAMAVEAGANEAEFSIGDGSVLDLSGWEPDEEAPAPTNDASLAMVPIAIHRTISLHQPVDDAADWSDLEAFLPEHAAPMPKPENAEAAEDLRALLLRALREGSVPSSAVDDLDGVVEASGKAGVGDSKSALRYVIEDLGAETDERFEYRASHETFEVYVAPTESPDEEQALDDALAFLADLESRRNDPMRHYMREAQRKTLIGADDEVSLAKAMETAAKDAVEALAEWPRGLALVFEAIDAAKAGERLASAISTGPRSDSEIEAEFADLSEGADAFNEAAAAAIPEATDETEPPGEGTGREGLDPETLFAKAHALRELVESSGFPGAVASSIRERLHELWLARAFLLKLADSVDDTEPARRFTEATRRLGAARDRMAGANLRLVLSHAKRYLFSGIPMDDLIQEGNIGLLRAVDKFDWRRGYKFSTMATWWIRQQISRCVGDTALAIRLPVHSRDEIYLIEGASKDLEKSLGKAPTIEQLASRLDLKPGKIATLLRATSTPLSIEELDDELVSIGAFAPDPCDSLETSQLVAALAAALDGLDSKPAKVLRLRFGIGGAEPCTLEEVGQLFDVTRERIRQIEAKAMRRLAHPARAVALLPWLDKEPKGRKPEQAESTYRAEAPRADTPEPPMAKTEIPRKVDTGPEALRRLLARASELGIAVEHTGSGVSSATWVLVDEAGDNQTRGVIRRLLALGFMHWPGRGYWK